ncbi:MAG: 16S rRNA processing protein RimM [Actinobacteria bacterium]|nr:16S rRNA processing protein RimM [Actinomycetota bacterium]
MLEIGRIGKPHGLKGELLVSITSDRPERTAPGAVWFLDDGPVTVEAIQPYQHRFLVRLAGVSGREAAEALNGQIVRAEPIDDPDALWVHELVGATVATPDGRTWGTVAAVLANPADDLLELDDGTLVPVGFVTDGSGLPERVVVDPPPGLLGDDEDG